MNWKEKLHEWKTNGFSYPQDINNQFIYETSPIIQENSTYKDKFIIENRLENEQNYNAFSEYINSSDNENATYFKNISGSSILIIPMPREGKNFSTIKNFIDNADDTQKKEFWKIASYVIKLEMKHNKSLWISTHGLGVPYFHLRIDDKPKYYRTNDFKKIE